jgi:predicted esterase
VIERTIAAATHGRYLVEPPPAPGAPMLVGFHGYGEGASEMFDRLRAVDGAERFLIVSIQGLHRFYQRRTDEVIASWMTRQDRELAIADNIAYVSAVVESAAGDWQASRAIVFAGFSQGVAMAFRAAASSARDVRGVLAAGGDVPPEIDAASLARLRAAAICRGARDEWYTAGTFAADVARLKAAGVDTRPLEFDGGHEWSAEVLRSAAAFLRVAA